MADSKLTGLTELAATPTTGDMLYVVDDPGGTPLSKKITVDNLSNFVAADTQTFTNKTIDANGTGNSISNIDVADLANGTDGELITWDAAGAPTTVAVGTATEVLTSNGAGVAPTFQAAAGGVSWGDTIAGTTAPGIGLTVSDSSDAGTAAINILLGNTQGNDVYGILLDMGTSLNDANVQGMTIRGKGGSATTDGHGVHMTLWVDSNNEDSKVLSVGNDTTYNERGYIRGDGRVYFAHDAGGAGPHYYFGSTNAATTTGAMMEVSSPGSSYTEGILGVRMESGARMSPGVYATITNNQGGLVACTTANWAVGMFQVSRTMTNSSTANDTSGHVIYGSRHYACGGNPGTLTNSSSLIKLVQTATAGSGTVTLDGSIVEISTVVRDSADNWCFDITHDNDGSGGAAGIDMSSFSVDEPLFKFVADAITTIGTVSHQFAVDVAGTTFYLTGYTHGS